MAMTRAERQRNYMARQKAAQLAEMAKAQDPRLDRLNAIIAEAQALAAELNAEMVAKLQAEPLTRESARKLEAIEGKFMGVRLPVFHA